jgi:hypothetical protein
VTQALHLKDLTHIMAEGLNQTVLPEALANTGRKIVGNARYSLRPKANYSLLAQAVSAGADAVSKD